MFDGSWRNRVFSLLIYVFRDEQKSFCTISVKFANIEIFLFSVMFLFSVNDFCIFSVKFPNSVNSH